MMALSSGRRTSDETPLIRSLPDGSTVKLPPPLLRTETNQFAPRVAAAVRVRVPLPVSSHTNVFARSETPAV